MSEVRSRPEVVIREAVVTDAGPLARLLRAMGWFSALDNMTPGALEDIVATKLECLCASSLSTTSVATAPDGAMVGYSNVNWVVHLFLDGPEGYVSELFLASEARGQGIGTLLLDRIVAEAEARGAHRLTLLNGKHRESYERGFYSRKGWEEREHMANFVYLVDRRR